MAGVGEASAILGLVSTSAKLSKTISDIAVKYKNAKHQIEALGNDVQTLGEVLNQLHRMLEQRGAKIDSDIYKVIAKVLEQCDTLFSEIDAFKEALYSRASKARPLQITLRGKTRWVFEAAELQVLQARIDSTKMNLLLLMTLECLHKDLNPIDPVTEENAQHIRALASQCDSNVERLETIEERMMLLESQDKDPGTQRDSIISFKTASSARSTRDSILNLYSRDSYLQNILSARGDEIEAAPKTPIDEQRFSRRIDDYLREIPNSVDTQTYTRLSSTFSSVNLDPGPSVSQQDTEKSLSREAAMDNQVFRMQFPGRAKALQSHAARSSHKNELSIEKDEILDVSATNSKWWSARNQKGEIGVVRSRYVVLQDESDDSENAIESDNDRHELESQDLAANDDDLQQNLRERHDPTLKIFRSFQVHMEDSTESVLPIALTKYNINADWKDYSLNIVCDDQERSLGLREKPLILFRLLDRQGKKPTFMLRKHRTLDDLQPVSANHENVDSPEPQTSDAVPEWL